MSVSERTSPARLSECATGNATGSTSCSTKPWHPSIDLAAWQDAATDPRVVVADGSEIRVTVRNGHLSVVDGPGSARRERKFPRIPRTVKRLVILGGHGYVTLEAQRWLAESGVPWSAIENSAARSEIIATSGPDSQDARILRAQSRACEGGELESAGFEITKYLLATKIRGQLANVAEYLPSPESGGAESIRQRLNDVENAETWEALRAAEGLAASAYWRAWDGNVHVPFSPHDLLKVPAHWQVFVQRLSLANAGIRNINATDPVNATLNYLYRLGESEGIIACHALGLSPVLGINHADKQARNSMALDLLEALRPVCDQVALKCFDTGLGIPFDRETGKPEYFDRRWLFETREGVVRLVPPYTHRLASQVAEFAEILAPIAYQVTRMLADAAEGFVNVKRPTGVKRNTAVQDHRRYPKNRLNPGVTTSDIVPDPVWEKIASLIPMRPPGISGPNPAPDRARVAAICVRFILGCPWAHVHGGYAKNSVIRWHAEWKADGTWDQIRSIIEAHGHLQNLVQ